MVDENRNSREERLREALRANLRRRKAQARDRKAVLPDKEATNDDGRTED